MVRETGTRTDANGVIPAVSDDRHSPAETASPLLLELDCLSWGIETDRLLEECGRLVEEIKPLWVRVANWSQPTIDFLKLLRGQRVLWKVEYTGHGAFEPRSNGRCWAQDVADQMLDLDVQLVVYTFDRWNVERIRRYVPALRSIRIDIVPVAQKSPLSTPSRAEARAALGFAPEHVVLGVGGVLGVPFKGIEELVDGFLATCMDPQSRLLAQVIPNPLSATKQATWRSRDAINDHRLVVRLGRYKDWEGATFFYQALDFFLVNSTGESWCRMLAEAVGYSIPSIAVRADSATNRIVPGVALVDQLTDFRDPSLAVAMQHARSNADSLKRQVLSRYSLYLVRRAFLTLLRQHTPEPTRARLDMLASDEEVVRRIDASLVH